MLAGGSSDAVARGIESYSELLLEGFRSFDGTVISGGTRAGVSALAGNLGELYGERIRVIGYLPERVPDGVEVDEDVRRYHELRRTSGRDFSVLEPVQAWRDVLSAGLTVEQVSVLGIGGGTISAVEYRLGLALGARCAVVEGSGGAADELLQDPQTDSAAASLRADPAAIQHFLG